EIWQRGAENVGQLLVVYFGEVEDALHDAADRSERAGAVRLGREAVGEASFVLDLGSVGPGQADQFQQLVEPQRIVITRGDHLHGHARRDRAQRRRVAVDLQAGGGD